MSKRETYEGRTQATWRHGDKGLSTKARKLATDADVMAAAQGLGVKFPKATIEAIAEGVAAADARHLAKQVAAYVRGPAIKEWQEAKKAHDAEQAKGDPGDFEPYPVEAPSPDLAADMALAYRRRDDHAVHALRGTLARNYGSHYRALAKVFAAEVQALDIGPDTTLGDVAAAEGRAAIAREILGKAAHVLAASASANTDEIRGLQRLGEDRPGQLPNLQEVRDIRSGKAQRDDEETRAAAQAAASKAGAVASAAAAAKARNPQTTQALEADTTPATVGKEK